MALTPSNMIPLGTQAPVFSLPDVTTGKTVSLSDLVGARGPANGAPAGRRVPLLVMFICRHCPYVQHIKKELGKLGKDYPPPAIAIVAISSNDAVNYPDDRPESLKAFAKEEGYTFAFLYDESQEVAKAYSAACTPDFFLFDASRKLVYRGQLDDSRPGNNKPLNGRDLRAAIDAVLAGKPVSQEQRPSIGCNIKWKT